MQIHTLKHIHLSNFKQLYEGLFNIQHYQMLKPDILVESFDDIFSNQFFKGNNTNGWSSIDLVTIYTVYNSLVKSLYTTRNAADNTPLVLIHKISFNQFATLVENHIVFLFDQRLTSPYFNGLVEELKYLVFEVLKKDMDLAAQNTAPPPRDAKLHLTTPAEFGSLVERLLQKMIFQLELTCDYVEELMSYCTKHNIKLSQEKSVNLEDALFKLMPRYEECQSSEQFEEKANKFINDAMPIFNDEALYFHHAQQKKKQVPLLENREGYSLGTQSIDLKGKTFHMNYIEDGIFKRVAFCEQIFVLNDFSSALFIEMTSASQLPEQNRRPS